MVANIREAEGSMGIGGPKMPFLGGKINMSLDAGSIYLIKEDVPSLSRILFGELISQGRPGLVLSRYQRECFEVPEGGKVCFHWLSDSGAEPALSPEFGKCWTEIAGMPESSCVYLDRLDYLLFKNGFDDTLSFIQDLNDLAHSKQHTVLLSLDPLTVEARELTLMEKETRSPGLDKGNLLSRELASIMKYLGDNAVPGRFLRFADVQEGLDLSRPTVRKRLRALDSMGLVTIERTGRSNRVELTELGRTVVSYLH